MNKQSRWQCFFQIHSSFSRYTFLSDLTWYYFLWKTTIVLLLLGFKYIEPNVKNHFDFCANVNIHLGNLCIHSKQRRFRVRSNIDAPLDWNRILYCFQKNYNYLLTSLSPIFDFKKCKITDNTPKVLTLILVDPKVAKFNSCWMF